jgi:phosphoribosylformimino-5-aminoimidazole carboxamide ribotide isomerase
MTKFEIYPAIDLRHGQVVRLQEGDPARQTVFGDDPLAVAARWASLGARWFHVVNLDGAFGEANAMQALLPDLCRIGPRVQFGGGVRSLADVEAALAAGVARVILGTVAVEQPDLVREAVARFGSQAIAVGMDTREGRVRVRGWQADGGLSAIDLGRQMKTLGVELVICTDIVRDGLLSGVNVQTSAELAQACGLRVIASGGVAGLQDIRRVRAVASQGVEGVIVGRALYQGTLDLREALALAEQPANPYATARGGVC